MPEDEGVDQLQRLQEALDSNPESSCHHYELGLYLWRRGEEVGSVELKGKAAECFVVSAKLDPSNGGAFRYLGHYYSRLSVDEQRASKCYLRAVNLNPEDFESGESACDLLDAAGKESLEIAICREATGRSPKAFWAFRRMGYMLVHQKKWSEAVQSLQQAIRGYPTCADLWEALGLAYQHLGMFSAAIKSYGRAIELEESKTLALIESGNIHLLLGSFRQGIEQFRRVLEVSSKNVSAQFGLASALLGLSKECIKNGAFVWATSLLEEASEVVKESTYLSGACSSLWKLQGDIQVTYAKCFPWEEQKSSGSPETARNKFESSIHSWRKTCILAARSAKQAYQQALHLAPWQANIYTDVANALYMISSFEERNTLDLELWQLPEKMAFGSLILEGVNGEFWVALGCLSCDNILKQHALIRALQLDVSLSVAWAFLGKLYRNLGNQQLAKQAFDHARSIDPSLALPWAGMAVDLPARDSLADEAYESCLRAVQMLPIPEFQIGLGKLAALSGHLLSPQVLGAMQQAVQHAPHYPESHNLKGLMCEARADYCSAIGAYENARYALKIFFKSASESQFTDVSVNLARSLCQAGRAAYAQHVCEDLKSKGLLDNVSRQLYIIALWQQGKKESFLTEASHLAKILPDMDLSSGSAALELICRLVCCSLGQDQAVKTILKSPREFLTNSKMIYFVAALCALDPRSPLHSLIPRDLLTFSSEGIIEMNYLTAVSKMLDSQCPTNMRIKSAQYHLKKALHLYPDSASTRKQLGSLLLCSKDWTACHIASRCTLVPCASTALEDSELANQILGSASAACYSSSDRGPGLSFPSCEGHSVPLSRRINQLQKWLRREPWNCKAQYLLILCLFHKACKEKFPQYLCSTLKRLLFAALSRDVYIKESYLDLYRKFQLLLCASEICLQSEDYSGGIKQAIEASRLAVHDNSGFFAHLQLCRAYTLVEDWQNLGKEYMKCLQRRTCYEIGWISLKYLESRYRLRTDDSAIESNFMACLTENEQSRNMWIAVFNLVCSQGFVWNQDLLHAEAALSHACSMGRVDTCFLLCHGAICMELARQQAGSRFLTLAVKSLTRAQETSPTSLPVLSALLAQALGSLGDKDQWENNIRSEWFSWPADMRPAELYFQMHLIAGRPNSGSKRYSGVESSQTPEQWLLRAIHVNPSCLRYWKAMQKLTEL